VFPQEISVAVNVLILLLQIYTKCKSYIGVVARWNGQYLRCLYILQLFHFGVVASCLYILKILHGQKNFWTRRRYHCVIFNATDAVGRPWNCSLIIECCLLRELWKSGQDIELNFDRILWRAELSEKEVRSEMEKAFFPFKQVSFWRLNVLRRLCFVAWPLGSGFCSL